MSSIAHTSIDKSGSPWFPEKPTMNAHQDVFS
jgi:hypothetical protein